MHLLNLALALVAYRLLLQWSSAKSLATEVEDWFFVGSDTGPIVVVVLAIWLLYRRSASLRALSWQAGTPWISAALALLGSALLAWASITGGRDLLAISLALNALAYANHFGGGRAVRLALIPALFPLFAVPLPGPLANVIVFQFQLWTTQYASAVLGILGISSFVSGDLVVLSGDTFSVIEGCSGMRSVQTLTMVAILLIDLFRRRGLHAALILFAAPLAGFAVNGLRVVTLILNPHSDIVAIHNLQGAAVLLVGVAALYLIDGLLARLLAERPSTSAAPIEAAVRSRRGHKWAATGVLAALLAGSLWIPEYAVTAALPVNLSNWAPKTLTGLAAQPLKLDRSFLGTVRFSQALRRRYATSESEPPAAGSVDLFVGVAAHDRSWDSSLSPKNALPGSGWRVRESGEREIAPGLRAVRTVVRSGTRARIVYAWTVGAAGIGRESLRALFSVDTSPWARVRPVLVIRMSTPVEPGNRTQLEAGEAQLLRVYEELQPRVEELSGLLGRNTFSLFLPMRKNLSLG